MHDAAAMPHHAEMSAKLFKNLVSSRFCNDFAAGRKSLLRCQYKVQHDRWVAIAIEFERFVHFALGLALG